MSGSAQDGGASWQRWLPGLRVMRSYQPAWLRHDAVAGLVLTTMLVPVGIAYAQASGIPGIYGLYATIVPLLAYAVFGPSRILVLGPDSALAGVILAVVLPLSAGDPQRAVVLASAMAIVSGIVCVAAGLARLGFVTELLSKPIRYGYMNGIALTVLLSQLPKLLGFSVQTEGPLRQIWAIASGVLEGKTNVAALLVGASTLALILLLQRRPRDPGHSDRGGGCYARRGSVRSRGARARVGAWPAASGVAGAVVAGHRRQRFDIGSDRWASSGAGVVRGYERTLARVRDANAHAGRPQPGDGRLSASRTSQPASSRAFQSAAAHHVPQWPRPPGHARN